MRSIASLCGGSLRCASVLSPISATDCSSCRCDCLNDYLINIANTIVLFNVPHLCLCSYVTYTLTIVHSRDCHRSLRSAFHAPPLFAPLSGFLSFHRWHNLYPLLIFLMLITPRMSLFVWIYIYTHLVVYVCASVCICGYFSLWRRCVCVSKWLPVSPFPYFFVNFSLRSF